MADIYTRDTALEICNLFERIADRYGFDVSAMMEGDCYSDLLDEIEGVVRDVAWGSRVLESSQMDPRFLTNFKNSIIEGRFSGTK